MSADIYLAIDDSSLVVRTKLPWSRAATFTFRLSTDESIEILPIGDIPYTVSAMIHYLQKKFGEPEEIA